MLIDATFILYSGEIVIERIIRRYEDADLKDVMSAWENASKIAHPLLPEKFQAQGRIFQNYIYPTAIRGARKLIIKLLGS